MRPESPIYAQLYKVQMIKLSYCLDVDDIVQVVNSLQVKYPQVRICD
jgi:hypothetical protein